MGPGWGRAAIDIGSGAYLGFLAMADDKALKRFNGESDDPGKDLKRWKAWASAKLATLKDIKPPQKGPWLFTLLDGAAYEAVEHFTLDDIAIEDGDRKVWEALHSRFPEKEPLDQMGEVLGEVFALCAADGETSKQWTARVKETFEKCKRMDHHQLRWIDRTREGHHQGEDSGQLGVRCSGCCIQVMLPDVQSQWIQVEETHWCFGGDSRS